MLKHLLHPSSWLGHVSYTSTTPLMLRLQLRQSRSLTHTRPRAQSTMADSSSVDPATSILCGEFVQSVYDTTNAYEGPFLHLPLYGKSLLFPRAHVTANSDVHGNAVSPRPCPIGDRYRVTRYIYCTVKDVTFWPTSIPWIGYVAESSAEETLRLGRRDIVVAFCGTTYNAEWMKNIAFTHVAFPFVTPEAKVHKGFFSVYTSTDDGKSAGSESFGKVSLRDQIHKELIRLLNDGTAPDSNTLQVRITFTGHSFGAALATLAACDVGFNIAAQLDHVTVSAITFASPRVGNDQFKTIIEAHTGFIWRYRSLADRVPSLPPTRAGYVHVGTKLTLDWGISPYVSISRWWLPDRLYKSHNMELHLHVIAGENNVAVYTSMEGLLPDLPEVPADFAEAEDGTSYAINFICGMSAWEEEDRDLLKQMLNDVKEYLRDEQQELEQYLREIMYIGMVRDRGDARNNAAPRHRPVLDVAHSVSRLRSDQESPFDKRDYTLLNKSAKILKTEYGIPAEWLVHPNKDMVFDKSSNKWLPRIDRKSDIPSPSNPDYN